MTISFLNTRRKRRSLLWSLLLIALFIASQYLPPPTSTTGYVTHVADGDSFSIGTVDIRLMGIDAPELKQTCLLDGVAKPCGVTSRDVLTALVKDTRIACEGEEEDRYGRLLAHCYTLDAQGEQEASLNALMVEKGRALAFTLQTHAYVGAEARAKSLKLGLWNTVFETPQEWRDNHPR